jgi:Tol biopolymer transport system component
VIRAAVALASAAVLLAGAASATREPARPAALLTFTAAPRTESGQYRICIARSDGTNRRRIVGGSLNAVAAAWSPNGSRVAFAGRNLDPPFRSSDEDDVVVADARGRLIENLTPGYADQNLSPKWSRDGRWIAFVSDTVSVVPSDGSRPPTAVPLGGAFASDVAWFPDGSLAVAVVISDSLKYGIYRVNVDGSHLRYLVRGVEPAVSPNGSKLAFTRISGRGSDIYIANADGTKVHRLTRTALPEQNPGWSPDGRWIAFERTIRPGTFDARGRIVIARSDGTGAYVAVTAKSYDPFYPTWRRVVSLPKAPRASC